MNSIYETLVPADQGKIDGIVSSIREHLSIDGIVDLDLLMATLERMNEVKKEAREGIKLIEKKKAEEEKAKAFELGREYIASLKEGDMITFVYGTGAQRRTATLPIDKKGGASTVQVIYTPEMLGPLSKTNKRNIRYDKIVVPENFKTN